MSDDLLQLTAAILQARKKQVPMEEWGFPTLHEGQVRAERLMEKNRFVVLNWGRRAGKTTYALRKLGEKAQQGKACAYAIPSNPMLVGEGGALARAKTYFAKAKFSGESPVVAKFKSGGYIEFWTVHDGADRIRGREYDFFVGDEWAENTTADNDWQMVIRPTLIDRRGTAMFISTPRRGSGFHRMYQMAEDAEDWGALTIESWHNPFLPEEEVPRTLEAALNAGWTELAWRQQICADFEAAPTELVFPEFNDTFIRVPEVKWEECSTRGVGVDMGGGDPNALYKVGRYKLIGPLKDSVANRERLDRYIYAVYDEYYEAGAMSMKEVSAVVAPWHLQSSLWGIALGESQNSPEIRDLQQLGWTQKGVQIISAKGNPESRYGMLSLLLRENRLIIDPKCERLIDSLYRFKRLWKKNPHTGEMYLSDSTDHQYSHSPDAIGHIVQPMFGATPMRDAGKRKLNYHKPPGKTEKQGRPETWGQLVS